MLTHSAWNTCNRISINAIKMVQAQDQRPTRLLHCVN